MHQGGRTKRAFVEANLSLRRSFCVCCRSLVFSESATVSLPLAAIGGRIAPGVFRNPVAQGRASATKLHGLLVEVVYEFLNQRERAEFDPIGRLPKIADEDVAAAIHTTFRFGSEHSIFTR